MSVGCTGKVRFETFGEANRAAKNARRKSDRAVKAYACRECHGFHVGANARTPASRERKAAIGRNDRSTWCEDEE